jgi:hypothetical protein
MLRSAQMSGYGQSVKNLKLNVPYALTKNFFRLMLTL